MNNEFDSMWTLHSKDVFNNLETTDKNQSINHLDRSNFLCSFCNTSLSSPLAIKDHLLLCGNKTDQCPKCQKFIRRAIFAYHYENNCAMIDESDDLVSTISTGFDPSLSESHLNDPLLFSSRLNIENTKDNKRQPTQIIFENKMDQNEDCMVQCLFCGQNCMQMDLKRHKEQCFETVSRRSTNNEQQKWTDKPNQNNDQSLETKLNSSNLKKQMPCHYCKDNELFDSEQLSDHIKTYHQNNSQPLFQKRIQRQSIISTVPCEYCEKQCSFDDINTHQMNCFMNQSRTFKPHLSSTNSNELNLDKSTKNKIND